MPRLFIAIDLPTDRSSSLRELREDALPARWTPPEQYHVTLRFLGDTENSQAETLKNELEAIDLPSFLLGGHGLGVFPSIRKPHVLVARIHEDPGLMVLQSRTDVIATGLGLNEERKPFNPHITVARFAKASSREVRGYLKMHQGFSLEPFFVREFRLYESRLGSEGAVHTVLQHYPLRTASDAGS